MAQKTTTGEFSLETLLRKRIEKRRRNEKDARIHRRLSALLWLDKGYTPEDVADLLDVCPRTVRNWLALFHDQGLDALCSLQYEGDPG
jgi:transposase